ncbi:MAG: protein phosphatase 2C domain-containing protein [Acidobacteria bacterium]|nr:protein phosphatase 2C domain-containing protein [Acidobacteriota bacterium]
MNPNFWRVAHASAIGLAHINQNTECQDRFACRTIETAAEGEILIAVVADGAGSTTDGQTGAAAACAIFTEEVADFLSAKDARVKSLNEEFGRRWIGYFQQQIAATAAADKKEPRDYASTLIGAVIGPTAAAFYQIGDGGIVFSPDGAPESYRFAVPPVEAEYVNVTDFITDETAAERLRFVLVEEPVEDLILFSDGIYAVAVDYQSNRPHEPFLMPMIAPLRRGGAVNGLNEKLENFLASPKINEKTDDDKTIILASRAGATSI